MRVGNGPPGTSASAVTESNLDDSTLFGRYGLAESTAPIEQIVRRMAKNRAIDGATLITGIPESLDHGSARSPRGWVGHGTLKPWTERPSERVDAAGLEVPT